MKNAYNKKKINLHSIKYFLKYLILILIFMSLFFFIYNELKNKTTGKNLIQLFSNKFDYNYKSYQINTLKRVDVVKISEIMYSYLDQSIFLIPLNLISENLHSMKWVKDVDLSTNLKNHISIEVVEYKPIGLYFFNEQLFYFSEDGKIIDKLNKKINENFIIFYGNQSLKKANNFINIIKKIKQIDLLQIKEAYYINNRRWDVKLRKDLLLHLPEKNIENSFINYFKLLHKFKDFEIAAIKSIDLRNKKKAIIRLKVDD